jgi:triosephosphate isomerase
VARRPMMAANWKMNKLIREAEEYVKELLPKITSAEGVDVAIFAPFTSLPEVVRATRETPILAGAQNLYYEDSGAYTGEVSAPMIEDVGAGAVIVGHSERREIFGESDDVVARKAARAVSAGLLPIVCVGETKEERDAGSMWEKVSGQVRVVFERVDAGGIRGEEIVFAYEPVWAIGTGETATSEDAQDAIGRIRGLLGEIGGESFAEQVRILYGGSNKQGHVDDIIAKEDVDGGLVGGASLEAASFAELVNGAAPDSSGGG